MEHVREILSRWGVWVDLHDRGAAGYPRRTIEGRLRDEGGVIIRQPGRRAAPVDEDTLAEWCERAVCALRADHPGLAAALRAHYVDGYSGGLLARVLEVSERTARDRLRLAEHYIAGAWTVSIASARQRHGAQAA